MEELVGDRGGQRKLEGRKSKVMNASKGISVSDATNLQVLGFTEIHSQSLGLMNKLLTRDS